MFSRPSGTVFKAGWRPMIGWVAVVALSLHFILIPVYTLVLLPSEYQSINTGELLTLVLSLLGMGAYRTYEKQKGLTEL